MRYCSSWLRDVTNVPKIFLRNLSAILTSSTRRYSRNSCCPVIMLSLPRFVFLAVRVNYVCIMLVTVNDHSVFAERHEGVQRVASNCCSCSGGASVNTVNSLEITSTRDPSQGRQVLPGVVAALHGASRLPKPFCVVYISVKSSSWPAGWRSFAARIVGHLWPGLYVNFVRSRT